MLCVLTGSLDNTRAALHFARTARSIVMRPKVNEVNDEKAIIKAMMAEIHELRKQLVSRDRSGQARLLFCSTILLGGCSCSPYIQTTQIV